ncbi:hypothetical protein DB313_06235 (plasmid) [Borrelia turcica IST7]|uniref:Uncharacterized protein n=1 Tax=Borrelia turcica IST7 TaxID=1104446 RepID=A0A386PPS4_9SPIR|nr:DUF1473 family protein [Borrelia turcica]AYE37098.1 hypothetical protein DB313_06235 [Borrelia turcica IST7]
MRYKMKILTKSKIYEYTLKVIPVYEWDSILGIDQMKGLERLNELSYLKEITNLMIHPNFINEFYLILTENRRFAKEYKEYLIAMLYEVEFDMYHLDPDFKEPAFLFLEQYENNVGDFVKYPYINENWNYEYVAGKTNKTDNVVTSDE